MLYQIGRWVSGQHGALFGLDARIALAVFGIISGVAGVAMVLNMDTTRAKSLADELNQTGQAIEHMHGDIKLDIFQSLENPSEKNAFQALFDNGVFTETDNVRSRWNGPYIKFSSVQHPRYGDMVLRKQAEDHTQSCEGADICYLYLVYSRVPKDIVKAVDLEMDGKQETAYPEKTGRLQWTVNDDRTWELFFRATRALSHTQ